jgi:membrane protein required for colicin V production
MNYIDIIIGLLLLVGIISGWRQGFVRQLFGLLALILGVYCAYRFSHFAAHYIVKWFHWSASVTSSVAFVITFVIVLIGVFFVGRVANRFIKLIALGTLNSFLGALLSLCKWVLVLSVCLVIIHSFISLPDSQVGGSFFFHFLEKVGNTVFPYLHSLADKTLEWL